MSLLVGPSRHFTALRKFSHFRSEADIPQAVLATYLPTRWSLAERSVPYLISPASTHPM